MRDFREFEALASSDERSQRVCEAAHELIRDPEKRQAPALSATQITNPSG